jgi:hypothetical protein
VSDVDEGLAVSLKSDDSVLDGLLLVSTYSSAFFPFNPDHGKD